MDFTGDIFSFSHFVIVSSYSYFEEIFFERVSTVAERPEDCWGVRDI